ncbi:MAG: hypothetical protein HY721_06125 [Planctomycetes bacterium]|nr:hypothetical protein [Planctomycetota bacterium]
MTAAEKFRNLLAADGRYDAEAYNFIYEALDWTLKKVVRADRRGNQHVTGKELLEGIRQYALEQYGCLARMVLENWGVYATEDFGEIVFNLVEFDLMGRQESDSKEDFREVYDFSEAFDVAPVFCYVPDRDEWRAAYVSRARCQRSRT